MPKQKYYVVWAGHAPGIYTSWEACKEQIEGFAGAKYRSFPSMESAEAAMKAGPEAKSGREYLHHLDEDIKPALNSICVDAACKGNPGIMEYRGVLTDGAVELFKVGPFPDGNNNTGEFLALVHALAWLKKQKSDFIVYSDSGTAMAWVGGGKARTKLERTPKNKKVFELLARAEKWLAENPKRNEVRKWDTRLWGEIPADFGRK